MSKPYENFFRITLHKSKHLNPPESSPIQSFKLLLELNSISKETEKASPPEHDYSSKRFYFELQKSSAVQVFNITAFTTSWLSFTNTVGKLSIPLSLSKLNDQRQWFYLKNDNDENVIGILTSLYCEVSEGFLLNNTLNVTKGNIYPRAELSCENLHSNLINTLLNRTMTIKDTSHQCVPSNKVNSTCYIGSCDYTNDRTLHKDDIKSPSANGKSNIHISLPTEAPIQTANNNATLFSPIYTERNVSFSLKEQTTNQSLLLIEAILNHERNSSYLELSSNGELGQKLLNKIKALNDNEEELNSQTALSNKLNEKIKEKENILKRERNKLEEMYRKYKTQQAEYETKSLNLAQSNIQFENDQNRFMLEREIFLHDKDNFININLMLSSKCYTDIDDTSDVSTVISSSRKAQPMSNDCLQGQRGTNSLKRKKEVIVENPSNYHIAKSKSKPNSTGSTTNYTSGHNSEVTSNDYQSVFYNTSFCQDNSNTSNIKYFAPIAEINLTNSNPEKKHALALNPLADSLECGMTGKKALPNNNYLERSALRKNSKQIANGTAVPPFISEVNAANSRKKSVKNQTVQQNKKGSTASNGMKGEKNGKKDSIANTIAAISNSNLKNGLRLSKKIK